MQGLELWVPLGHVRASWKVSALWLFLKTSQTSCFPGSSIKSRSFAFSSWAQGDTDTWVPNATSQSGQCKVGMKTSDGADVVLDVGLSTNLTGCLCSVTRSGPRVPLTAPPMQEDI